MISCSSSWAALAEEPEELQEEEPLCVSSSRRGAFLLGLRFGEGGGGGSASAGWTICPSTWPSGSTLHFMGVAPGGMVPRRLSAPS